MNLTIVNLNTQAVAFSRAAVPKHLTKYRLTWANLSECYRTDVGHYFVQEYYNDLYSVHYYIFDFSEPVKGLLSIPNPTVLLHFLLKGKIQTVLTNTEERIIINPGTFQLFMLPDGSNSSTIHKGITESFIIKLSPIYLKTALAGMDVLQRIVTSTNYHNDFGESLRPLQIDGKTESILRNDLFTLREADLIQLKLKQAVYLFLSQYEANLLSGAKETGMAPQINSEIETIREEIIKKPNKKVYSVESLAKRCSVSITTFQRYFKNIVGTPIREFVIEQCMSKARILLANTNLSLLDISEEVGYNDVGNMSKTFKQHYGITPKEYRTGQEIKLKAAHKNERPSH